MSLAPRLMDRPALETEHGDDGEMRGSFDDVSVITDASEDAAATTATKTKVSKPAQKKLSKNNIPKANRAVIFFPKISTSYD